MSQIDNYRNKVNNTRSEIASLSDKKAKEQKKVADLNSKILSASRTMQSSKSMSTINSKRNEIARYQNDLAKAEKSKAGLETKIAKKNKELDADLKRLNTEEIKESKKQRIEQETFQRRQVQTIR